MNILLGDIHGNLKVLYKYVYRGYGKGGCIYQIGDFGAFDLDNGHICYESLSDLNEHLISFDTHLKVIRGNHDNPKYWTDDELRDDINKRYTNIEFLPDYHIEIINDKKFLFIGGSISVDRSFSHRVEGESWWSDEVVVPPKDGIESLPEVDVVIAHNCPSYFNLTSDSPEIRKNWAVNDSSLIEDLNAERELLDKVMEQAKPQKWYSGHFHNHDTGEYNGCEYRCININELFSLEDYKPFR